jgi:hypothetical protein
MAPIEPWETVNPKNFAGRTQTRRGTGIAQDRAFAPGSNAYGKLAYFVAALLGIAVTHPPSALPPASCSPFRPRSANRRKLLQIARNPDPERNVPEQQPKKDSNNADYSVESHLVTVNDR